MSDELIKRLRSASRWAEYGLIIPPSICLEAADVIEALIGEVEEYKAAYKEEHEKRISESKELYDTLTKSLREMLLMTPMRIEVQIEKEQRNESIH